MIPTTYSKKAEQGVLYVRRTQGNKSLISRSYLEYGGRKLENNVRCPQWKFQPQLDINGRTADKLLKVMSRAVKINQYSTEN